MSRTIPSYRIATEMKRSKWKIFRQRLGKEDRKEFDKMFSYSRLYNSAHSNACRTRRNHGEPGFKLNVRKKGAMPHADFYCGCLTPTGC